VYKAFFALTLFFYMVGCVNNQSINQRSEIVQAIVSEVDLKPERIAAGDFLLMTYHRGLAIADKKLMVYVEGDGYAWRTKNQLSKNPTPKHPQALKLAAKDSADSILYIARPCMYLQEELLQDCSDKFWSSHRYSEEVISSINQVIDWATAMSSTNKLTLIGYSGGGTIAALIAARRNDVSSFITIASNLDHKFWTEFHGISPMVGSLDPLEYAKELSNIKQIHFVGAKDKIVPETIIQHYLLKMPSNDKIVVKVIKGFDHSCCWEKAWPDLLNATNIK